jgi:hypothetical protein
MIDVMKIRRVVSVMHARGDSLKTRPRDFFKYNRRQFIDRFIHVGPN